MAIQGSTLFLPSCGYSGSRPAGGSLCHPLRLIQPIQSEKEPVDSPTLFERASAELGPCRLIHDLQIVRSLLRKNKKFSGGHPLLFSIYRATEFATPSLAAYSIPILSLGKGVHTFFAPSPRRGVTEAPPWFRCYRGGVLSFRTLTRLLKQGSLAFHGNIRELSSYDTTHTAPVHSSHYSTL